MRVGIAKRHFEKSDVDPSNSAQGASAKTFRDLKLFP